MSDVIVRYDRALNWFLIYFLVLFVVVSAVYVDVVGAMVGILFFFGFPLIVFVVTYAAILLLSLYRWLKSGLPAHWLSLLSIPLKLVLASMPFFYMDNRMAALFGLVRSVVR